MKLNAKILKFLFAELFLVGAIVASTAFLVMSSGMTIYLAVFIIIYAILSVLVHHLFLGQSDPIPENLNEKLEKNRENLSAVLRGYPDFPANLYPLVKAVRQLEEKLEEAEENSAKTLADQFDDKKLQLETIIQEQKKSFAKMAGELAKARDQAEKASAAKTDFLATMSHEIRTPMNGVISMANFLMATELTEEQQEIAETLRHSGESLLTVINDILDISKLEAGKVSLEALTFDLKKKILEAGDFFKIKLAEKGLYINIDIDENVPTYFISDSVRIRQILFNLIGNAIKFTETGGITIRVKKVEELEDGKTILRIEVEDTGIGISDDLKGRLFQKFSQADASTTRQYGGTGLGLAICKELSQLLGGDIGAEDMDQGGTCFWFTLTGVRGKEENVAKPQMLASADLNDLVFKAERALKVLVVDDNQINLNILYRILGPLGHDLASAMNGVEACTLVDNMEFDLVIMDVHMPVLGGVDAVKWIRVMGGEKASIPIIGCTADAFPEQIERYKAVGMNDVCTKPINKMELLEMINDVMGDTIHTASISSGQQTEKSQSIEPQDSVPKDKTRENAAEDKRISDKDQVMADLLAEL